MNTLNDIDKIIAIIFEPGFDLPCHIVAGVLTVGVSNGIRTELMVAV